MHLDVIGVVDINPEAPGLKYADEIGISTYTNMRHAISDTDPEVIIEITGEDEIVQELYPLLKPGVRLIDHFVVRLFWDLVNAKEHQERQLREVRTLEQNLQKERHFLQSIFDNLADLAVVIERDHTIIKCNRKFAQFVRIKAKDAIGKRSCDLLEGTELACDKEEELQITKRMFQTKESMSVLRLTPPPDDNHWEIARSPITDNEGNVEAILVTWHRITERVKLHREIESAEQKFKSFINSAQDWISIKDLEGRYVIVNPVTARAFHLPAEYFIGKYPREIFPAKMTEQIEKHDREVIDSQQYQTYQELIPIDGQDHHFDTIRFPLTDYQGDIIGVCTIARDNTREMRLKEQLAQSEKLAALGKLAAGVAHEINNPLTGILAYAEDVADELTKRELKDDMKVIVRETLRCRDIVRNLLDFARQDDPKLEEVNPNEIINNSLHLVERLPQFRDITIEKYLDDNIPEIHSDPQQVQQVLLNFMLNAADAMKLRGKIKISTEYDPNNDNCIISVEDNGPGIPENLIDKIFEPFFSTKGTNGLGLAVSWGIVERHRGTIEVDMPESGGAIFKIVLPSKDKILKA